MKLNSYLLGVWLCSSFWTPNFNIGSTAAESIRLGHTSDAPGQRRLCWSYSGAKGSRQLPIDISLEAAAGRWAVYHVDVDNSALPTVLLPLYLSASKKKTATSKAGCSHSPSSPTKLTMSMWMMLRWLGRPNTMGAGAGASFGLVAISDSMRAFQLPAWQINNVQHCSWAAHAAISTPHGTHL